MVRHRRRRDLSVRLGAVAAALAASLAWGSASRVGATPDANGAWTVAATLKPSAVAGLTAISCADAERCVAVGQSASRLGVALSTADGGTSWQLSSTGLTGTPGLFLTAVSCVPDSTTAYCVAVGRTTASATAHVFFSSDNGASWSEGTLPTASTDVVASVSCASGTAPPTCVAAGAGLYASVDGGATWSRSSSVPDDGSLVMPTVSCANALDCMAGGRDRTSPPPVALDYYTTDGGTTWLPATAGASLPISVVTCPSEPTNAIHCVGMRGRTTEYSDDGASWTTGHSTVALDDSRDALITLSCAAPQACAAIAATPSGSEVLYAADGGAYWHVDRRAAGAIAEVRAFGARAIWRSRIGTLACAGTACFAVGATSSGAPVIVTGPSQLKPVYLGEPAASALRQLVQASVHIQRLGPAVIRTLPTLATDTAANLYGLPRTCATTTSCVLGDVAASRTIVVYGDSHARMWLPAILPAATADGFRVVVVGEDGCTVDSMDLADTRFHLCAEVQAEAMADIAALEPAAVILSNRTSYPGLSSKAWEAGMELTISRIEGYGAKVVLIGDTQPLTEYPESCLSVNRMRAQRCAQANPNRARPGEEGAERVAAARTGAIYVDPTPWLCTTTRCSEVIGTHIAYWDWHHISTTYAQVLSNVMAGALKPIL